MITASAVATACAVFPTAAATPAAAVAAIAPAAMIAAMAVGAATATCGRSAELPAAAGTREPGRTFTTAAASLTTSGREAQPLALAGGKLWP
jgi:hypothetical protein